MDDNEHEMAAMLKRDAESIDSGLSFDPKLHRETMRRIRQSEKSGAAVRRSGASLFPPALVGAAAAACLLLTVFLWPEPTAVVPPGISERSPLQAPPASLLAYRNAMLEGDDKLLAMLDRDSRLLLPQSAAAFQSNP